MDVQQIVGAALQQFVVDIAESRVLLRDLEFAGVVRLEDGLHALTFTCIGSRGLGWISMAVVCVGTPWLKAKACRCASFSGGVRRRRPFSECQNTPCTGEIGCANGSEISVLSFQLSEISCAKVETSMSSGTDKTGGGAILFRASSMGGTDCFSIGSVFGTK